MTNELLVTDLSIPSKVYGVHGARGLTQWKSIAGGHGLRGPYEAVEWACVPAGGLSGEHLHSRTEEVYILLTGVGEASLNGKIRRVHAGELILTGLGATHGLRNVGQKPLSWLTLEIPAPSTVALARSERQEIKSMPLPEGKVAIVDLHEELDVDPTSVLHGPLRRIRMLKLAPGKAHEMQGRGFEYSIFVLDGSGTASVQAVTVPIGTGVAVTTSGGESLRIEAAGAGLTAVCASFEIAPRLMESRVEK